MRARLAWLLLAALALVVGFALGRVEQPRPAPAWDEVGSLSAPRSHAQAVALVSGDILVLGGLDPARPEIVLGTTELIDPRTGRTTLLGAERVARIDPSVSTLGSGVVVVAGGSARIADDWQQVAVTEIVDPWTRRWRRSASLLEARADHGATVLRDGRVLVAGGHRGRRMLDSVELFDPLHETWTRGAPLPSARQQFSIATLPSGMVLVAGGLEAGGLPSKTSLLYDPARDVWVRGPDLSVERVLHATVVLDNGDVLLIGGQRAASGSAERYDFRRGAFVFAGTLAQPRLLADAATLPGGALVVGGLQPFRGEFDPLISVEVYRLATNEWTRGPAPAEGSAFGAVATTDDAVWLIGGAGDLERALDRIARLSVR